MAGGNGEQQPGGSCRRLRSEVSLRPWKVHKLSAQGFAPRDIWQYL